MTSPAWTSSPGSRRKVMAMLSAPVMGAISISELPPWSSPRAATEMTTLPRFTRVVGVSARAEAVAARTSRMVAQAPAPTTASTIASTRRRSFRSDYLAALHARSGRFGESGGGGGADQPDGGPGAGAYHREHDREHQEAELHRWFSFFSMSTSVTIAPAERPETATSSGLRASSSTWTGR